MDKGAEEMIRNDNIPVYCYHCGKNMIDSKEDVMSYAGNIHKKCNKERRNMLHHLKIERWKEMMKDPKIKKKINEIDNKILREGGFIK